MSKQEKMRKRGRPPSYDPHEQMQSVMNLFWRKGYYDTSVVDLIDGAGISRAAICTRHGGKKSLLEASVLFYEKNVANIYLSKLHTDDYTAQPIIDFFSQFVSLLEDRIGQYGCFICNLSTELSGEDREIAAHVERFIKRLRILFRKRIISAKSELRNDVDPDELADYFVGALIGFMNLARSPASKTVKKNYIKGVIYFVNSIRAKNE